ncbi:ATPase [Cryomorphaceae bacterium]|nr:ATPase [Cryomorphaceae bacterium]
MSLRSFRERVNIFLFDSKERVLSALNYGSLIVSLFTIGTLVYFFGYPQSDMSRSFVIMAVRGSFAFYFIKYFLGFVYSFHPRDYFRETWFEGLLMLLILINSISLFVFGFPLVRWLGMQIGFENLTSFYVLFIQGYILFLVGIELTRATTVFNSIRLAPPTLLIFSFLVLISLGCGLLSLPEMNTTGEPMPFIDALFTAISASCVTGLIVVDTATYFTTKGQIIIMFLIQLGGLNIISFATFIALFSRKGIGIRHQSMFQDSISADGLNESRGLLRQIFLFSFIAEIIGAVLIFMLWSPKMSFEHFGDRFFYSVFHSISAFNNAGFSLLTDGLFDEMVRGGYLLHIVIAILIFFGGLGFPVISDIWGLRRMRERIQQPWRTYSIATKIAIYTSIALVVVGAVGFFLIEDDNTMSSLNFGERVITSIFQSVTTRTAGFNTVDIGALATPTLIMFMFLMFIGASSGSTGGGIKTSTFASIFLASWATIRGKKNVDVFKHTIHPETLNKAYSIFLFSATFVFLCIFALSIAEPEMSTFALAFEEISAFATVGLSTGITGDLSDAGKIIVMISMFVGRVGTLTLAFALSSRVGSTEYKYPKAQMIVG